MGSFLENQNSSSTAFTHVYQGVSQEDLQIALDKALTSEGYKKEVSSNQVVYSKGSRAMRLLLGAFIKYFKYRVVVNPEGEGRYTILVSSDSTGFSGGLIGVNQIKKETTRLFKVLQGI